MERRKHDNTSLTMEYGTRRRKTHDRLGRHGTQGEATREQKGTYAHSGESQTQPLTSQPLPGTQVKHL